MIDVANLWTSESAVENLRAVTTEFYNVMCKEETLPLEKIIKLDDKRDFAFICRCGNRHTGLGSIWSVVARTINQNTPDKDHPEYEDYTLLRKGFMNEVQHIDVRDYAEPFLKETAEWQYVEAAIAAQQKHIDSFTKSLCSSTVTMETHPQLNVIVSYYCEKHETEHYMTPQQNNHFRSLINGSHVPEEYIPFLSKLSQRIVLRDTSAVFREFNEQNPAKKVDNVAFLNRVAEKEKRKAATAATHAANAAARLQRKAETSRSAKKKKNSQKPPTPVVAYDDPNLYILKPSLMSEDWLAEFHVCGRKVSYAKVSEALIFKHKHKQDEYNAYECPYCSGWHLGREGKDSKQSKTQQAKRGMFWYRRDHRKANIFIHKIMTEEF